MIDPHLRRTVAYQRQPEGARQPRQVTLRCKGCRETFGLYDILAGRMTLVCYHCRAVNRFVLGGGKMTQEIVWQPDQT